MYEAMSVNATVCLSFHLPFIIFMSLKQRKNRDFSQTILVHVEIICTGLLIPLWPGYKASVVYSPVAETLHMLSWLQHRPAALAAGSMDSHVFM